MVDINTANFRTEFNFKKQDLFSHVVFYRRGGITLGPATFQYNFSRVGTVFESYTSRLYTARMYK
jgi:hypothetical protein